MSIKNGRELQPFYLASFHLQTTGFFKVGDSGFEPLTSSVSRKRSPPELIARA